MKLTTLLNKLLKKRSLPFLIISLVIVLYTFYTSPPGQLPDPQTTTTNAQTPSATPTNSPSVAGSYSAIATVSAVVDGDTIKLTSGETVRYIGVNTPETKHPVKGVECFGKEASAYNSLLVLGKEVRLEKDVSETDRYGRLLRYVYVTSPETNEEVFVNGTLVEEGFAYASSYPPDVRMDVALETLQQQAKLERRGLWGACAQQ